MSEQLKLDGFEVKGYTAPGHGGVETTIVPSVTAIDGFVVMDGRL